MLSLDYKDRANKKPGLHNVGVNAFVFKTAAAAKALVDAIPDNLTRRGVRRMGPVLLSLSGISDRNVRQEVAQCFDWYYRAWDSWAEFR